MRPRSLTRLVTDGMQPYQWLGSWMFCLLCGTSQAQPKITYEQNVLPLLREKCVTCHNADKSKGGLDMSTYAKLMEGGSSGEVVKPGDADGSRLLLLAAQKEEPKMPPNSPPMAKESLELVRAWIANGALENAGSKSTAPVKKAETAAKTTSRRKPDRPPMPEKALPTATLRSPRANAVTAMAASPWAPLIAVAGPQHALLYNSDTLELLGVLPFPHGQINVLKFSRSGEWLLAAGGRGGKSGKAVIYSITTGELVTQIGDELDAITAADLSPDQSELAIGGPNRLVQHYSVSDGAKTRTIKKHTEWITAIEYSPDGVLLATADRNGGLSLWETSTGQEYQVLAGHRAAITDLTWRDDANVLVSASEEGNVKYWSVDDGKQIRAVAIPGPQAARFFRDGRLAVTGRDAKTRLFDANGAPQRELTGSVDLATKTAVSHDGARVFTGDWTGLVVAWNTADGARLGQMSTNPPTAEERLEIAKAAMTQLQKAVEVTQAAVDAATQVQQKIGAEAQPLLAAYQSSERSYATAKSAVESAQRQQAAIAAALPTTQRAIEAAQVKLTAYTVAHNHLQVEAAKAKENNALAQAAQNAKKLVDDCEKELQDAQTALAKLQADQRTNRQELDKTVKALPAAEAAWKKTKIDWDAKSEQVKAATTKAVAAKAAFDKAVADRDAARLLVEKLTPKP